MSLEKNQDNSTRSPVSVILIAYNEVETIAKDIEDYYRVAVKRIPGSELIVTEDGSTDGTSELLRQLSSKLPIRLIQSRERKGYLGALLDALTASSKDWILFSDTGGKFNPDEVGSLIALRDRAELVIGVRTERRDQIYRRLMTNIFNQIIRCYFRIPIHDIDSGLRIYHRKLLMKSIATPLILKELAATELTLRMIAVGARLAEVPVSYLSRIGRSRGMPPEKIPRTIFHVLSSFPRLKRELRRLRTSKG